MNETKVAVVILNYNGKHFLEKFLPAIVDNSHPHEVYIADNGSTDDSLAWTAQHFPGVKVVANQHNHGYALGYNLALERIKSDYYVLLNSDVEVTPNWLVPLKDLLDNDSRIAACQPRLLDYNNRESFEYAGAGGGFIDKLGYPFCRGRVFNTLEKDNNQYHDATEVFWATGACLFVRADTFWQAGGLDGDYFAHMEEIDLCWRFKNLGYTVFVQPASTVYHVGGGTLNKYSTRKTYLNFRNNLTTLTKNHPGGNLWAKILVRLVLDGVAGMKFLFEGQPRHCFAVLRAHFSYYAWLPAILRKRRAFKQTPGFKYHYSCVYKGSVVFEYFIEGKRRFTELKSGFFSE